jgi:hypothetical protein
MLGVELQVSACSDAADLALLHPLIKSFEMTAEDGCGFFGREQFNYFQESSLHTTDTCFAPCPRQFCECFVNKRPIMMLVEAGLDWKRLEVQKAHNRRHAKDFPVYRTFFGSADQNPSLSASYCVKLRS